MGRKEENSRIHHYYTIGKPVFPDGKTTEIKKMGEPGRIDKSAGREVS